MDVQITQLPKIHLTDLRLLFLEFICFFTFKNYLFSF